MNALKNLSLILLLSLAFTGCHNKSSKINDFNLLLYAPEYASGFDIKGAGGKETPNASWRCLPLISPCLTQSVKSGV